MALVRSRREAEELAAIEEERREYVRHMDFWRARGWKPMHREAILPMWQCLRCSTLAFDRDTHATWHAAIGDPLP